MPESQEIHYIFSRSTPDASILTANPEEVAFPGLVSTPPAGESFDTPMKGGFVIRVPSGLDFDSNQPRTASDQIDMFAILAEKSTAILQRFPGFTLIVFDDMLDATGFDSATASGAILGGRNGVMLGHRPSGGGITSQVDTVPVGLASTPTQAVIYLETFLVVPSIGYTSGVTVTGYPGNPIQDRMEMIFRPVNAGAFFQIDVSFNNGSTFVTNVFPEDLININPADQGNTLIVRFIRKNLAPAYVGISGWALIY